MAFKTKAPTTPAPDATEPAPDALQQAEALLARFAAGGWLLSRGDGGNGTQADNRAVLDAAIQIALAYEVRASAEMICAELRGVRDAIDGLTRITELAAVAQPGKAGPVGAYWGGGEQAG